MKLEWLGTAGFRIRTGKTVILLDPYISRNPRAVPPSSYHPSEFADTDYIFVSHGHFDHIMDVPRLMRSNRAVAFFPAGSLSLFLKHGIEEKRLRPLTGRTEIHLEEMDIATFPHRHIPFDPPLIIRTLIRTGFSIPRLLPLLRRYPLGEVLSCRFAFRDGGIILQHFGSSGPTVEELAAMPGSGVNVLLLPYQGNSDILSFAMRIVSALKPETVIPQHFDNFFPPISQFVDPESLREKLAVHRPAVRFRRLEIGESSSLI